VVILVVFGALAGAVVGSFGGVVRSRGWRGALHGRSHCEGCGRELRWFELVPFLSYSVQRGRCRTCGSRIGAAVLLAEIAGAAVGAVAVLVGLGLSAR